MSRLSQKPICTCQGGYIGSRCEYQGKHIFFIQCYPANLYYYIIIIIIIIINIVIIIIITDGTLDWCDCGTGKHWVDIWDPNNPDDKHRIDTANPETINWPNHMPEVKWQCDGQSTIGTTALDSNPKGWYVYLHTKRKPFPCSANSGRLEWATPGKF